MSGPSRGLPARPSLEQLRKQAKEKLAELRGHDSTAALHDAQLALAREYGFASWPLLAHHAAALSGAGLEPYELLARDLLAGYSGDQPALARLNERFGISYDLAQLALRVREALDGLRQPGGGPGAFTLDDARLFVARQHRFDSWAQLANGLASVPGDPRAAGAAGPATAPFYRVDWESGTLEPGLLVDERGWDVILEVIGELEISGLRLGSRADDRVLKRVAAAPAIRRLDLGGATRISDEGLLQLAAMPQLEELDLSGWHSPITDRGLEALRHLPALRRFSLCWPQKVSDAGAAWLAHCPLLEHVDLMGTGTGDGAVNALAGLRNLSHLVTGRGVTDGGLRRLHDFPVFARWRGGEPRYGLMSPDAGPNHLTISGTFTDEGLASLRGLDGVFGFSIFGDAPRLTPEGLRHLAGLPMLGMLGCDGSLANDAGMKHIGALPGLRMAMVQGAVAGDDGFEALSRSATLEFLWGRECPNLTGRGFASLARMPALTGLAVSLKRVSDAELALLPSFPALRQLMPMDLTDAGFRHVGRCQNLDKLWCMYCRDTGDAATAELRELRLTDYYAGKTRITDSSLDILAGMATLERIELWETAGISNAGVRALARLPRLRSLSIDGAPHVTREVLDAFGPGVRLRL